MSNIVQLDHKKHVLQRPTMYIGPLSKDKYKLYVFDDELQKREIHVSLALYKIFDEIFVNAMDHSRVSKKPVTKIEVNINEDDGSIRVCNNGDGFIIEEKNGIYTPELAFGHLLTSSNYDDSKMRTVGGQNGIGAKGCNIFSKEFHVEIASNGSLYKQSFYNNMDDKTTPVITKAPNKQEYTCITFIPDYARFEMSNIEKDFVALCKKRCYEGCVLTPPYTKVYYNGNDLNIKNFLQYVKLYIPDGVIAYEQFPNWEIAVCCNKHGHGLEHVSYVNGISTMEGGKHVDYFCNKIAAKMKDMLETKLKKTVQLAMIKNCMLIFINATISNPTFEGQYKNKLTTPSSQFGGNIELSNKFYQTVFKSDIANMVMDTYNTKLTNLSKKTDGKKATHIKGLVKLEDANWAGTAKSHQCTLILTEGDSAKAMAMEGLAVIGKDRYGVFPLRGKLLNVKDVSVQKLTENKEVSDLKKILGLESNKKYDEESLKKSLRYGRIMIMSDQDHDGLHIRGLIMNMFHTLWPTLLHQNFICALLTPIVRVHKPNQLDFYSLNEFREWFKQNPKAQVKYYKGLGTWKPSEARGLFKTMRKVDYVYDGDEDDKAITMIFSKNQTDERKVWITDHSGCETDIQPQVDIQRFKEFVDNEFVQFSIYDVERSIPNVVDGFKPSQRKVMFGFFKRNNKEEVRVSQIAGYISEHSSYHHGEDSLYGTIIGMAQTFVGSGNNITLLAENGTFGSRNKGGKDSAAPRYIHTALKNIANKIFPRDDFPLLKYLDDDGLSVEPEYYVPIIPMILVNGALGIGTGFSTKIPSFNPYKIIQATKEWAMFFLHDDAPVPTADIGNPWYNGFKGTIYSNKKNSYVSQGIFERHYPNKIVITELPIGKWTEDYKEHLESLIEKNVLKHYESHTTSDIRFVLTFNDENYVSDKTDLEIYKDLNLESRNISTNCMYLFDSKRKIKKYDNVNEIIQDFALTRIAFYLERKNYKIKELQHQIRIAESKAVFISKNIDGTIVLLKRSKEDILSQLKNCEKLYHEIGYEHLLKMPIYSLGEEKYIELKENQAKLQEELDMLQNKHEAQMWLDELIDLEKTLALTEMNSANE